MIFVSAHGYHYKDFDWEMYVTNYRDVIENQFNTKDKLWWHFLNIGESKGWLFFDINKREINKQNFNWSNYSLHNPYVVFPEQSAQTSNQFWEHFFTFNTNTVYREQLLQRINKYSEEILKKKNILYYVGVTCTQNFNTGIQRVARMLSNYISKLTDKYNIFLIKFDPIANDFVLINETELNIFSKYQGYNHLHNCSIEEKQQLFQKIKNIPNNLFILPELFYTHHFELLDSIIQMVNNRGFISIHIYHDDTTYNNVEMDKKYREEVFNKYIYAISKCKIIIPNSKYSETTYLFHKQRLGLTNTQIVHHVCLAGEMVHFNRIFKSIEKEKYIFSNISVCERKNARTLIKAFNKLNTEFPHLRLIICGEIYEDNKYYKTFKNLLNNNISFISKQSDEQIVELYKKCFFSVYPSIEEGFGLPIYESLWNNTPVICHNATSTLEIASTVNSPAVKCIDCLNEDELFATMKQFINGEYLKAVTCEIKNIYIKTWNEYGKEVFEIINTNTSENIKNKNPIYYYIDHTTRIPIRTGIQILTIYLAKQLLKIKNNIIFVKWDNVNGKLCPSTYKELKNFFINNDDDVVTEQLVKNETHVIDTVSNCVFLCPEVPLVYHEHLYLYLTKHNFKTVYILHDIIPLVLDEYPYINERDKFSKYFYNNILKANKLIGNSEFTKNEFIKFCTLHEIKDVPSITSIMLPYQYRNTERIFPKINMQEQSNNSKVTILLPGSLEPRKQQILVMEYFNYFIKIHPFLNVELIAFGHSTYPSYIIDEQIKKSANKIKYLGVVSNDDIINLYKNATFTCFVSKYEGYGLPVAESLWHGTPVLTSCLGSTSEIGSCGGCYFVNTYNPKDIYDALCILIKNPQIILKLKEDLFKTNLISWSEYTENICNEIEYV